MYDQYKQITNSRRVHDVRMGSAGPPEYFWLGQPYVFGIIYSLTLLIEIGLTDLKKYGEDQSRSTFVPAALIRQYILYFSRAVLNRLNKFENPQMIASA